MAIIGLRDIKDTVTWIRDELQERKVKIPVTEKSLIVQRRPTSVDILTPVDKNRVIVGRDCDLSIHVDHGELPYVVCKEGNIIEMDTHKLLEFWKNNFNYREVE